MKMLLVLVMLWLGSQYAGLWIEHLRERAGREKPSSETVEDVLRRWPESSRSVARMMISERGLPDRVFAERLDWEHPGKVGVVVYRDLAALAPIVSAASFSPGQAERDTRSH